MSGEGDRDSVRVRKTTVSKAAAAPPSEGGWRQNGRKRKRAKQGDPPVPGGALGQQSAYLAGGSQSVRSSDETGDDREAKGTQEGGSVKNRKTETKPTRVPAKANRRGNQPGAIDLADAERLTDTFGDEAKSRSLSTETPLTGKPDAGNPPVRFGGRGRLSALPTPIGGGARMRPNHGPFRHRRRKSPPSSLDCGPHLLYIDNY